MVSLIIGQLALLALANRWAWANSPEAHEPAVRNGTGKMDFDAASRKKQKKVSTSKHKYINIKIQL